MCKRTTAHARPRIGWLLMALVLVLVPVLAEAQRSALLVTGKTSLYQRILTRPGAILLTEPGAPRGTGLPPLSIFYVYSRRTLQERQWLEVGTRESDGVSGWIDARYAIDWHQTLTLAFTRTNKRDPALFFRERDALVNLLDSERPAMAEELMRTLIREQRIPADFPVIAEEPATYVDPNREFYLLPILDSQPMDLMSGHSTTLLNVAAVTLQPGEPDTLTADPSAASNPAPGTLTQARTAVVFVIDTTSSMGPYIDRTRTAIRHIYERLKSSRAADSLSFGLVAYRDNIDSTPDLEYVTRVVATLDDGLRPAVFLRKIQGIEPARVSSQGFVEDAFAGVHDALQEIDWSGYTHRYIVLVTDAGAREGNDPLARSGLGAERLRILAQEKDQSAGGAKVAIAVLHLLTPEGRGNHARAADQYHSLSRWGDSGDLYFPVAHGSVDSFGTQVDTLTRTLLDQLESVRAGKVIEVPDADQSSQIVSRTALVGRAMQLAYLGRERGSRAPRLINAWVADRDPGDPAIKTLEVRVLINKNQLSNLQETLQAILAAGERSVTTPKDFFAQLRGAAATLARDPTHLTRTQVRRLADVGLVGEWLDDLPYTSQVMNLTEARWVARSYAEQQEVLDVIDEKIDLYRRIHDDTDRWVRLGSENDQGLAVTTIPLDALP